MIVDTSAVMAILVEEREEHAIQSAIRAASGRLSSASTRVELGFVTLVRRGEPGLEMSQALLKALRFDTVPFSAEHAGLAIDAFRRFGKGRRPTGLNFGEGDRLSCPGSSRLFPKMLAKTAKPLFVYRHGFGGPSPGPSCHHALLRGRPPLAPLARDAAAFDGDFA
jgi:ribonuclease VapC